MVDGGLLGNAVPLSALYHEEVVVSFDRGTMTGSKNLALQLFSVQKQPVLDHVSDV